MSRALVIDDENSIRRGFKRRLEKNDIPTDVADGWEEAQPFIENTEYDVIFLDIKMPGKNGIEILKEIMNVQSEATVVMMTGDPSAQTAAEALRYGAAEYLEKPVPKERLLKIAFRAIERRELLLRKKELEIKDRESQKKIEELISGKSEVDFSGGEFQEMVEDLIKSRKKSFQEVDEVSDKLDDALKLLRGTKEESDGG